MLNHSKAWIKGGPTYIAHNTKYRKSFIWAIRLFTIIDGFISGKNVATSSMFLYLYFSHKMDDPIGTQQLEDQPLENQGQRLISELTGQMTQSPPGSQVSTPHTHMSAK